MSQQWPVICSCLAAESNKTKNRGLAVKGASHISLYPSKALEASMDCPLVLPLSIFFSGVTKVWVTSPKWQWQAVTVGRLSPFLCHCLIHRHKHCQYCHRQCDNMWQLKTESARQWQVSMVGCLPSITPRITNPTGLTQRLRFHRLPKVLHQHTWNSNSRSFCCPRQQQRLAVKFPLGGVNMWLNQSLFLRRIG